LVAQIKDNLAAAEALMAEQKHVWIAIPAYTGTIHLSTMRSVISDMLKLAERGDRVTIFDESGNAMIGDCRGLICAQFLASDATHLVFVDSDVSWAEGVAAEAGGLRRGLCSGFISAAPRPDRLLLPVGHVEA
jgi:hypothetical protein